MQQPGKWVYCHGLTGLGWRKYMAISGPAAEVRRQVNEAFAGDARPLENEMVRLFSAVPGPLLVRRDEEYGLPACGEDAVTFRLKEGGVQANSLSPVNPATHWQGETADRLVELLEEGSGRAILDYLASPDRPGCDAWCPECDRVYCREHYSVEAEWSGYWHTATYATCPLGREREFE
jgi:hypothetical protein